MILRILIRFSLVVFICSLLSYCSSNEEPQPIDCNLSTIAISLTSINPTECGTSNGAITATATGGDAPYEFAIDSQPYTSASNFANLTVGTFVVRVKDKNGCERSQTISLTAPGSNLTAAVTLSDSGCKTSNGSISINVTGGTTPYSFQLNNGTPSTTPTFSGLAAGSYSVKVTDNAGCSTVQSVRLRSGTTYSATIKTIIEQNCAITGCHIQGGNSISLTTVAAVQANAANIRSRTQSGNMPQGGAKLPQAQLDAIACWVDDGAPNN